ncbi:MAG TPA: hypothetical protein DDW73_13105 [Rhizobium sp.]|nr:hypothetical protein [Rhizobium sp.]
MAAYGKHNRLLLSLGILKMTPLISGLTEMGAREVLLRLFYGKVKRGKWQQLGDIGRCKAQMPEVADLPGKLALGEVFPAVAI